MTKYAFVIDQRKCIGCHACTVACKAEHDVPIGVYRTDRWRAVALTFIAPEAAYKLPADGLQQAKSYTEMLSLKFAYATNGHRIIEHDYFTGQERELAAFPTPAVLWARLRAGQGHL